MSDSTATGIFRPYTEMRQFLPKWFWIGARIVTLAVAFGVLIMLVVDPELGITLFWRIFIPSLPLIFAIVPGIWRQICPMAFLNQLPVEFGFSAGKTLPMSLKESSYLFAIIALVGFVTLKHVTFYDSPMPLLLLGLSALGAAFVGGLIFKGRSGWCGTFCPLGPLQKVYGHAPVMLVKNGYCETGCVGCQKNCYDFSPRSAFFEDLSDKDKWYAGHRQVFVGLLPGLILSFWLGHSPSVIGYGAYLQETTLWLVGSAGSFFILTSVLRNSVYKVAAIYGVVALFLYYWFAAPVILGGIRDVLDIRLPDILAYVLQAVVVVVAARNLYAGLKLEQAYEARVSAGLPLFDEDAPSGNVSTEGSPDGKAGTGRTVLIERSSGKKIPIEPGKTVLELLEGAGVQIDFGCRTGMCGADPVCIEEGADNLSPPSQTELETLRRLGLEGKARMACVSRARRGPVTINLAVDLAAAASLDTSEPAQDLAEMAGVKKIVIVGNGVAGITAADRLRQASSSLEIDVVSRENHHFYNRMAIGRAIYGRTALDGLDLLPGNWAKTNNINVWLNTFVTGIDREARTVSLGTGETLVYDKLLLATGGRPAVPPLPGIKKEGCFVLRKARDALKIRTYAQRHACRQAVVVGGGVLGIEAADALRLLGLEVTIVHLCERLMDRNLDDKGSDILAGHLRSLGMNVLLQTQVAEICGDSRVQNITLNDGQTVATQICLFCIGVSGEKELAVSAGLDVGRGVIVDNAMRTSDPNIYAIGDVAEFGDGPSGLWTLGVQHAQLATDHILNRREGSTVPRTVMQLKMDGIDVVAYGVPQLKTLGQEEIVDPDEPANIRRRLVIENGKVVGAFVVGPPGTAMGIANLIRDERDVSALLPELRRGNWDVLGDYPATPGESEPGAATDSPPVELTGGDAKGGGNSALAWAAGILLGIGIAMTAAMLIGTEPDKMKLKDMMAGLEDAMTPKRNSVDATSRFGGKAAPDVAATTSGDASSAPAGAEQGATVREAGTESGTTAQSSSEATTGPDQIPVVETSSPADREGERQEENSRPAPPKVGADANIVSDRVSTASKAAPAAPDLVKTEAPVEVTAEDLRALLAGKKIRGGRDFGGKRFTLRLSANGSFRGEISLDSTFGSTGIDTGRWSVRGGQFCFRFSYLASGRQICSLVSRKGETVSFASPKGRDRRWTLVQ